MIAVDTNVLIYACDQSEPHRQKIALDLIASSTEGVLLWQVACEFLSASRKLNKQGFTAAQAWNRLSTSEGPPPGNRVGEAAIDHFRRPTGIQLGGPSTVLRRAIAPRLRGSGGSG